MRIVIDCFKLIKGVGKSIGIYNISLSLIQNLVSEKNKLCNLVNGSFELIVLGNDKNREDFQIEGVEFIEINQFDPTNMMNCIIWELFEVSRVCKKLNADRVLFPRGFCALTHPVYDIVMIHDMIPFYYHEQFPDCLNRFENMYIRNRLKASARKAKQIITCSEASKRDIIKYCHIEESKISTIYFACNAVDFHEEKMVQDTPYLCAITSKLPHKNAKGLLEGYAEYYNIVANPLDLIVIGIEDTSFMDLPEEVQKHVICYKFIKDDKEMYRLINNSSMFLFLSLKEGFGLPPIEAMQLNVPVICSSQSSLPEVVGEAAIMVDPKQPREIADAIVRVQFDKGLQEDLVNRGRRNLERFSWESRVKLYWNALTEE